MVTTPPRQLDADRPAPSGRELVVRSAVAIVVLVAIFGFALPRLADYGEAWERMASMTPGEVTLLVAVGMWNLVCYWPPMVVALPGLRLREAAVVNQASTAVAHTVPAGSAIAVGATVHMLRAWGFTIPAMTNQMLVTGVWNQFVKLGMPIIAVGIAAVTGDVQGAFVRPAVWGIAALTATVAAGALLLRVDRGATRVGMWLDQAVRRLSQRLGRSRIPQLGRSIARTRAHTIQVVRTAGVRLSVATIVSHVSLFAVLLVALRVVGVSPADVNWPTLLMVFALVRLLSAIPITPGGAGLVELGYVALLTRGDAAAPDAEIAAGVLLFRAITYVLPIVLGGVAWLVFRFATDWRHPEDSRDPRASATHSDDATGTVDAAATVTVGSSADVGSRRTGARGEPRGGPGGRSGADVHSGPGGGM